MQKKAPLNFLPCLVCGVDSGPVLQFFLWLIGGIWLASLLTFIWAYSKGKFDHKHLESIPLELEEAPHEPRI